MENLNDVIARNLKTLREEKKLSLDKAAQLTGISKSMLGQIERGESNPTINTVWKIANGLKISFTSLIKSQQSETVVVKRSDIEPLVEDRGNYKLYAFFPYEEGRRFEVYTVEIQKGGYLTAEGHGDDTEEFITVFDGELTIRVNEEEYTVIKGDSIRFKADKTHVYHNSGNEITRINMIIYYPE